MTEDPDRDIPARIAGASTIGELIPVEDAIQAEAARLHRAGANVEVIAGTTSHLNRALLAKVFDLVAPLPVKAQGCLFVMGSEGRGEQTLRTDQDNGIILAEAVPEEDLTRFRHEFPAAVAALGFPPCPGHIMVSNPAWSKTLAEFERDIRGWVMLPGAESDLNLAIVYDACAVAGRAELLAQARAVLISLMAGERAHLARLAKAADQFEDAHAGVISALLAAAGLGNDAISIKKSGLFPIVHGARVLALEQGLDETSTLRRLDGIAAKGILGSELAGELKRALATFMTMRLGAELAGRERGENGGEAAVHLASLDAAARHELDLALKAVRRFKEILRAHYHLEAF